MASVELLERSLPDCDSKGITDTLADLQGWSLIVYRKFNDSFSVFEGSDFDIDESVSRVMGAMDDIDFDRLNAIAGLQPIVAKRHYHYTGSLRWFDMAIVPLSEIEEAIPQHGSIGGFYLSIPTRGESPRDAGKIARRAADNTEDWDMVVGLPQLAWDITSLAQELLALEQVRDETPELMGDRVARSEVLARVAALQGHIEGELARAFDSALWFSRGRKESHLPHAKLNSLASDLADKRFEKAPRLHNELLNRVKPSSNAVAAQNALLRRMALNEGEVRLGIRGFPAEGGLFASLLEAAWLYRETPTGWRFVSPTPVNGDPCNLAPTWQAALDVLERAAHRTVSVAELYDIWRAPPFGIKDGLLPVLAVAFILSNRHALAFYREGIFQARLTDLDVDYLARDPNDVQVRWMNLSDVSRRLLSDMADVVRDMDEGNALANLEPIDVARGLVAIYDQLPPWVDRTQHLSTNAKRVRHLFKQANDPNSLIFDDIPRALSEGVQPSEGETLRRIADSVREGLTELRQAYPSMLHRLRETLLAEIQAPNASQPILAELRARADNVRQLAGDHRLEAFIIRLAQFQGSDDDMESLASMAANKPPHNWVDSDIDRAAVELAEMAQRFIRVETFAHVKGRSNKRHAMAVIVGMSGWTTPVHGEFDVADLDRRDVEGLIARMEEMLGHSGEDRHDIILAALAELSARYIKRR